MRLERASAKAIRYAILNWHYSKAVPSVAVGYSVFNATGDWCGVVCYGHGATTNIAAPFGMQQGQVVELVRVALNGKQEATSQAVATSLRLLRKDAPLVQVVVSFADTEQGHVGTIYQASNWVCIGHSSIDRKYIVNGQQYHPRTLGSLYGKGGQSLPWLRANVDPNATSYQTAGKPKYIYPLTKSARKLAETLRKPYPKKTTQPAPEAQTDERLDSIGEAGGAVPTPALTLLTH